MTEEIDNSGKIDQLFDDMTGLQIQIVNSVSASEAYGLRSRIKEIGKELEPLLVALEREPAVPGDFMVQTIRACRWALVCNFGWNSKVREYIAEAQHQDGYGYWAQFESLADVIQDYVLYLKNGGDLNDGTA